VDERIDDEEMIFPLTSISRFLSDQLVCVSQIERTALSRWAEQSSFSACAAVRVEDVGHLTSP